VIRNSRTCISPTAGVAGVFSTQCKFRSLFIAWNTIKLRPEKHLQHLPLNPRRTQKKQAIVHRPARINAGSRSIFGGDKGYAGYRQEKPPRIKLLFQRLPSPSYTDRRGTGEQRPELALDFISLEFIEQEGVSGRLATLQHGSWHPCPKFGN
jgi:hypothetical protein